MTEHAHRWLVPDGWMPPHGQHDVDGHEAICFVNPGETDAAITLTFYFEDREPDRVAGLACRARRTRHVRLDRPDEVGGYTVPDSTPYALMVESDVELVVQHTRVDTRQPALSLMTTTATRIETVR